MTKGKSRKKSTRGLNQRLAKANRFNLDSLPLNRQGRLDRGQKNGLLWFLVKEGLVSLAIFALFLFMLVAGISYALVVPPVTNEPSVGLAESFAATLRATAAAIRTEGLAAILPIVFVLILLFVLASNLPHAARTLGQEIPALLADLRASQVIMAEGLVQKESDPNRFANVWERFFYGEDDGEPVFGTYYYVLEGRHFKVSRPGYQALVEGELYRLFYTPQNQKLINVEFMPQAKVGGDGIGSAQ